MLNEQDLTPAQQAAIERLYNHDSTLLIAGLGFGKAIVGLTAMQELLDEGVLNRILVLAPKRTAELTWGTEPGKWDHIDDIVIACGTPKQRNTAAKSRARIVVTNFENIGWMLDSYGDEFDGVLIDEISKMSKVGGGAVKKLRHWVKKLKWRAGMSATPVAESGLAVYSQALILDLGESLGTRYESFQRAYFYPEDYQQRSWLPFPDTYKNLAVALRRLVWVADDQAYKDALPLEEEIQVPVMLPKFAQGIYDGMEATGVVKLNGVTVRAESAAQRVNKLHQIAAGGLYGKDKNNKQILVWRTDFKGDALEVLLDSLDARPKIIFYQYEFELQSLREDYGTDIPVLGQGTKFTPEMLAAWNRGEIPMIFAHHASASHGLNLQGPCCEIIHLSPVWGRDPWIQTLGRIRRRGQPSEVVFRYVLVAQDTVDEQVLLKQDRKAEREKTFMDELRK